MSEAKPLHILVLCTKFPYPPKDGGSMAMMSMIEGFHEAGHLVTVLSMNTPKHYAQLRTLPDHVREMAEFHAVDVNTNVKVEDMLANLLFGKQSYHVIRFTSKSFTRELVRLLSLNSYDVVQLETLYMVPYLETVQAEAPEALTVLRTHNIEHEIWRRRARNELNPLKKMFFEITADRIKAYEEKHVKAQAYDLMVPITKRDGDQFKKMGARQLFFCNAGLNMAHIEPLENPQELEFPSVFYIGALDWEPNREGMRWFMKKVWPFLTRRYPSLKLYLAGRRMPAEFYRYEGKQVEVLGEVESAADFIRHKAIMVVPILSGSGMRVKIAEGMAYGKAIVATQLAAEGLGVRHGYNILLADEPEEFANCVSVLIEKRSFYDTLAIHAREHAQKRFDNKAIISRLLRVYHERIKKKTGPDGPAS